MTAPVAAETATLKQQILPLDCVFEEVNDGLGTLHYLTPEACGIIIPPTIEPTTTPVTSNQTPMQTMPIVRRSAIRNGVYRTPTASQSNPLSSQGNGLINVILLNNIAAALQNGGYLATVKVGSTFFYRPVDNPRATIRSITVTAINAQGITLSVQQLGLTVHLTIAQARTFDKLKNGQPAIGVRLESVDASGTAQLRLQLLFDKPQTEQSATSSTQLWLILLLLGVLFGIRAKPHWFGGGRRK